MYDAIGATATTADIENQAADNYSYDAIGNLIKDVQEEIDSIQWTVSGKVHKVIRTATSTKPNLEFEYDAQGQRTVKKVIRKDGSIAATYYLRDASGNVMGVYEYNSVSDDAPVLAEQYLYGSSRIGVATPNVSVANLANIGAHMYGNKSYELSDHLGNVRTTLSDYRRLAAAAIVNSATDYYPFGMVVANRQYTSASIYRYGFNGKENDLEDGWQDYGLRTYNPALARFFSVDPLIKKYPELTPYQFASNSPIMFIDIDGLEGGSPPSNMTRVLGGLKFVGGVFEMAAGATGGAATSWTGVGAVVGGIAVVHGADVASSGLTQLWTGNETQSFTEQGISTGLQTAGVSKNTANTVASYTDASISIVLTAGTASRPMLKVPNSAVVSTAVKGGSWVAESTVGWSQKAIAYQEYVTGVKAGKAFNLNGVKFDGIKGNVLLEAKSSYDNFVSKTGEFYSWFKGQAPLLDQARRQLKAAEGAIIEWNFSSQKSLEATKKLFKANNIEGITLKYNPPH